MNSMQSTGTWIEEAAVLTAEQIRHACNAMRDSAILSGMSVSYAQGLEDWEGGDDLVICPDANSGCDNCQSCPCAEVHSRSECHGWVNAWDEYKETCGCPECDLVDQEQYDEIHTCEPLFFQWPDNALRYGDISPTAAEHVMRSMLEAGQSSILMKKFGSTSNPLPKKAGTIKFRRYTDLGSELSGEDMLDRQLNKYNGEV